MEPLLGIWMDVNHFHRMGVLFGDRWSLRKFDFLSWPHFEFGLVRLNHRLQIGVVLVLDFANFRHVKLLVDDLDRGIRLLATTPSLVFEH